MSQAVLETVWTSDIDVLRMDIRVSSYLGTVWTSDIDGIWMNIEVFWHLETVWTSAWLLELAY